MLFLLNADNVACPKWRASPLSLSPRTDGSVVKMAVALPHLRGDSQTRAELPLKHDQIRKYYPPVEGGAFPINTALTRQWNRLAKISLPSPHVGDVYSLINPRTRSHQSCCALFVLELLQSQDVYLFQELQALLGVYQIHR